jgi:hypothetical protein
VKERVTLHLTLIAYNQGNVVTKKSHRETNSFWTKFPEILTSTKATMDCQSYNVGITSAFEKVYAKCLRNCVWFFILAAFLRLGDSKNNHLTFSRILDFFS